jgi:hypothetical protein
MNNYKRPQQQRNTRPHPHHHKQPYKHVTPESCNFNFINELHDYMITTAFISNANSLKVNFTSAQSENTKVSANVQPIVLASSSGGNSDSSCSNALFVPNHKDSLFWCMYVILNGFNKYELLNNQHFIVEQHEKIRAIELLRANKSVLKEHKIKPFSELENNLTNDLIDIKTFFAIAIVSKLNVIYIHNRMYFDFFYDNECNDAIVHVIHQTDHFKGNRFLNRKFSYESSTFAQVVEKYHANYYRMLAIDKPIDTFASYKVSELVDLCAKLKIELPCISGGISGGISSSNTSTKKPTKKEIYDLILAHVN